MMDMKCIVFVRGKVPDQSISALAQDRGIVVMTTQLRMYTACGLLYHPRAEWESDAMDNNPV